VLSRRLTIGALPSLAALVLSIAIGAFLLASSSASALGINKEVTLPEGEVGVPYEFEFEADEGCQPYHFHYHVGSVPGLTIAEDGTMSGTPTTAGRFDFWVEVTDGIPGGACTSPMPSQGAYSVFIAPRIEITAAIRGAKVGAPFTAVVTALGGGSLQWQVSEGSLPPGLALNRDTGVLTGVPSTVGTYPFTVMVSDAKRKASRQYTFVVAAPLAAAQQSLPPLEVGVAANAQIPFSGGIGPLVWAPSAGASLPAGLTLDRVTGKLTGRPRTAGPFTVPIDVIDTDGQSIHMTLTGRVARHIAAVKATPPAARRGKSYRFRLTTTGGIAPVSWAVTAGKLPRGLTLNRATGTIRGTPRAAGSFRLTARATDKLGARATRRLKLTVTRR
jgi:hypothetical protein